ncbi:hypothetical protein PG994_004223 [Apiospora phragmitis]|uniref:Uncharacterized protein n=1 Tax=Apiospora phragmitis TaxID=2905665 RepID=A0ABR1VTV2_9PEZI
MGEGEENGEETRLAHDLLVLFPSGLRAGDGFEDRRPAGPSVDAQCPRQLGQKVPVDSQDAREPHTGLPLPPAPRPAGSRPQAILQLRFRDIGIYLVRDPAGDDSIDSRRQAPRRLIIQFSLEYTKRYLGPKAAKTSLVPEIIYDSTLVLSPHVFLLAILFKNRAFKVGGLNDDPHMLSHVKVPDEATQLLLPFRPDILDTYLFLQAEKTHMGWKMSETPMTQVMLGQIVKRFGQIPGFMDNTICYNLDQSENISDSLRNLIMDHAPNSDTLSQSKPLMKQATSHGHSRDDRRQIQLTAEESIALRDNFKYVRLTERLKALGYGPNYAKERRELTLKRKNLMTKLREPTLAKLRQEFDRAQDVQDIQQQMQTVQARSSVPSVTNDFMAQNTKALAASLAKKAPALIGSMAKKIPAAGPVAPKPQGLGRDRCYQGIVACYGIEEVPTNKVLEVRAAPVPTELLHATREKQLEELRNVTAEVMGPGKVRRCFICVAKAMTLLPDDENINGLCRDFTNFSALGRHFTTVHLSTLGADDQTTCPLCHVVLFTIYTFRAMLIRSMA